MLAEAGVELVPISELVTNPVRLSYSNDDREVTF
jgi:hypothetical protein